MWPKRIIAELGREPQVGDWFAECCIEDFGQVETEGALRALKESYDEVDSGGRFWKTEAEGRAALEVYDDQG